jgi:predicted metal-binding membrane protein
MWPRAVAAIAWRGPGKVLLLASAAGWVALALLLSGDGLTDSPPAIGHRVHSALSATAPMSHSIPPFTAMWLAMILAMAPPLLLREVRRLWRSSLYRTRHLTLATFVCGYVGIWLLVGLALVLLSGWVMLSAARVVVAVAIVLIWHASPARQRCLNACHRVPSLRVFGGVAQWDALRYGVSTGGYCTGACGLAMLLVLLATDHHLAAMAVVSAVAIYERHLPARRPAWRLPLARRRSAEWAAGRI